MWRVPRHSLQLRQICPRLPQFDLANRDPVDAVVCSDGFLGTMVSPDRENLGGCQLFCSGTVGYCVSHILSARCFAQVFWIYTVAIATERVCSVSDLHPRSQRSAKVQLQRNAVCSHLPAIQKESSVAITAHIPGPQPACVRVVNQGCKSQEIPLRNHVYTVSCCMLAVNFGCLVPGQNYSWQNTGDSRGAVGL